MKEHSSDEHARTELDKAVDSKVNPYYDSYSCASIQCRQSSFFFTLHLAICLLPDMEYVSDVKT